jgi:ATP phosphoribosyltransferase regulatory subunit
MNQESSKALLPDGLRDVLPPDAGHEMAVYTRLLDVFAGHGYERVEPPLVEFEDTLLDGAGAALALSTFRLMDPVTQRMMGVRADMTPQVARIATTRLRKAERPLRLCYGGAVLRVRGDQLQPERGFRQAGVELIGATASAADAEVILLAYEALDAAGAQSLSVDISLPTLVPALFEMHGLDDTAQRQLRAALDRKDAASVAAAGGDIAARLGTLLAAAGPADAARKALAGMELNEAAAADRSRLDDVCEILAVEAPDLRVTVDPVENRGFEYHTGLSFTFFARGDRGELGRGGRYRAGGAREPATGFSLLLHNLLRAVPPLALPRRLLIPAGTGQQAGAELRRQGWITVAALAGVDDLTEEARRLGCGHYLAKSGPVALDGKGEKS